MIDIEITITVVKDDEGKTKEPDARTINQKREDALLLEKIKKYGIFNSKGEWVQ